MIRNTVRARLSSARASPQRCFVSSSFSRARATVLFDTASVYRPLSTKPMPSELPTNGWQGMNFPTKHPLQQHHSQPANEPTQVISGGDGPRTSVLMELTDRIGMLHDVLKYFWKYDVNITRIESRPHKETSDSKTRFDFFVDFDGQVGESNVDKLLNALKSMTDKLLVLDEKEVHWFPRHISELDLIANRILDAGKDLESDHPGFNDPVYRARRAELTRLAKEHKWDKPIPILQYTAEEIETWSAVWDRTEGLWEKYASKEYKVGRIALLTLKRFLRRF